MPKKDPPAKILDLTESENGSNSRDGARKRRDPKEPAAVVGLGASAGGINPLQQFFADMDPESGLAFVVVMHLSPEFESQLANVIQQKTSMPVTQVSEPVKVRPNHVYVIPPNHQLTFEGSMLKLVAPQQAAGRRVTIDLFFRTLAQAYGQRALCIILSGTDSDGMIGLKHIRAQGGVTMAQEPTEAEFSSMPTMAIGTGMVDWILPVAEMPAKLMEFVHNENRMQLPPEIPEANEPDAKVEDAPGGETVSDETRRSEDEVAIVDVLKHLRAQTGEDFMHYKRATVLRRIARRMQVNSIETIPQYLDFLCNKDAEARDLLHDLLIGVTHFFRDQESFAALAANIPQLFAGKRATDEIRVWVAGCASGEEAYSIAMLLREQADKLRTAPSIQVFATDLDEQAIAEAREGLYPSTIEADVSVDRLRRFFQREDNRYRIRKDVRDLVLFAAHNLLGDAPFSRLDLISCRNLLIYLKREAQERVFDIFHFALRPGGLLFVGSAETADYAHALFSAVDAAHRLYVRRSVPRPTWKIPLLPARITGPRRHLTASRPPTLPAMTLPEVHNSSTKNDGAAFAGQERRSALFGELHLKVLEHYGPPSVVVNAAHDIVHLSEHAGRYLQFRAGEPSTNLVNVVHPSLRLELRTALFRAGQSNENIVVPNQRLEIDGKTEVLELHVRPIHPSDSAHGFFLILFQKQAEAAAEVSKDRTEFGRDDLSDELNSLKRELDATVEQYEASSEELRASNEELQAMNEEMRSAAEELETSKEELQSVNEELTTVNHELKEKVEEISRSNSDLQNLMASTDLATIFLDRHLRIKRFTARVQEVFNILGSDIGRPISDLNHHLHYDNLMRDAETVLERLLPIETEVFADNGQCFLARIAPYRTMEDRIDGVILTFINITERKQSEETLRLSEERFRQFAENSAEVFWIIDAKTQKLEYLNPVYEKMFGQPREVVLHDRKRRLDLVVPEDREAAAAGLPRGLAGETFTRNYRIVRETDGETRWIRDTGFPIRDEQGNVVRIAGVAQDVTEERKNTEALRESETTFRAVANLVPDLLWSLDEKGAVDWVNQRWIDFTGQTAEEAAGDGWFKAIHPDDVGGVREKLTAALAAGKAMRHEQRFRSIDGEFRWFLVQKEPVRDGAGQVTRWFAAATDIHEQRLASEAVRESEEKLRLLIEGAPEYAMFLMDPANHIFYWSKGAEKVFGWTADEALGKSASMIFTPEDRKNGAEEREMAIARAKGSAPDRRWHLRKNGTRLWIDGVMHRLDDGKGELRGYAKVARNATDERHAQELLEQRVHDRTKELQAMNETLAQEMMQRQTLERQILEVTERERLRLSQDLHDTLCQELTATAFLLKSRAKKFVREDPEASEALAEGAQVVNRNAGLARDLARGLHALELGAGGLVAALRELASRTNEKVTCRCSCPRSLSLPNDTLAVNLYRIAQEAVTNAVKHAKPHEIVICIERVGKEVTLSISDDGKPRRPAKDNRGLGKQMMQYRASMSGGTLTIDSKPGKGTKVTCRVPLDT